jgi:drug/metabolite transporter (DMT)-like permease
LKFKYLLQLAALSALWGASFLLTRVAAPDLGPNVTAFARMLLATATLTVIMRAVRQPWPWQHWRELMLLGVLAVVGPHLLYAWAALNLPAGYGALLSVTSVMFGAFASAFMKQEVLTPAKITGCLAGMVGAALVVKLGPVEPSATLVTAAFLCMGGAAFTGVSTPFLKRATTHMEPLAITAGMHLAALALLAPGALHDLPGAHFTTHAVGAVVVLGVVTSGMAYWLYMRVVRHVPPMAALTSTFMSTGFGMLWAVLLLGEPVGMAMLAGGFLILLASLLVSGLNPFKLFFAQTG